MMNKRIKAGLAVYVLVMFGCVIAFFMQKSITYSDHIHPARERMMEAMGASLDAAEIAEHNRHLSEASIGMGNEIEEHLLSLLVANLATGVFLVFCILNHKHDNKSIKGTI